MGNQLAKSQHAWFISALSRTVGGLGPVHANFQNQETGFTMGDVTVAISDTSRNTKTDKKGVSHTYGMVTIEYIENRLYNNAGARKGDATAVMNMIIRLADKWSIDLRLRPMGVDGSPVSDQMLTDWYNKLGFTEVDGLYLVRRAKSR